MNKKISIVLSSLLLVSTFAYAGWQDLAGDVLKSVTEKKPDTTVSNSTSTLSNDTISSGLKEALKKGVDFDNQEESTGIYGLIWLLEYSHTIKDGVDVGDINYDNVPLDLVNNIFDINMKNHRKYREVEPREHSLIVFKVMGKIQHIGYMISKDKFIHIMENTRVSIESIHSKVWNKRIQSNF